MQFLKSETLIVQFISLDSVLISNLTIGPGGPGGPGSPCKTVIKLVKEKL